MKKKIVSYSILFKASYTLILVKKNIIKKIISANNLNDYSLHPLLIQFLLIHCYFSFVVSVIYLMLMMHTIRFAVA
jgi:hypothetical protein